MRHIIALAGEPATGKTTIVQGIIERLGGVKEFEKFKFGTLTGLYNLAENLFILGVYDGSTFAGTDRLSMAVIKDAVLYLENTKDRVDFKNSTLLFEGDRLCNQRFFDACKATCDTSIIFLIADEEVKILRHKKRGDTQSDKWLKGRETKIRNLMQKYPDSVIYENNEEVHSYRTTQKILGIILRKEFQS